MDEYLLHRLRAAYPATADPMIARALKEGIALADDAISGVPFLRTPVGLDIRGHVRRAGAMFAINEYSRRGDLPFAAEYERQTRGSWHWLNMTGGGVSGHLVKTPSAGGFPQDAPTRDDKRLMNQGDLFDAPRLVDLSDSLGPNARLYAWLAYGCDRAGNITHALWGIPASDADVYLASADILRSAYAQVDDMPAEPILEPMVRLTFTKEVADDIQRANDVGEGPDQERSQ